MSIFILLLYGCIILFIFCYSIIQLQLVWQYKRGKNLLKHKAFDSLPKVTIQLPLYNEQFVAKRLVEHFAKINYPKEQLEIQVLDDSTDCTRDILAKAITELQNNEIPIQHITRSNRTGFKAGALKHGLEMAKGEFIAIFDADFLPDPDFLIKTLPYFENEKVGVVQTKWQHLNEDNSLLTQLQSFGLDAHFTVEQVGRNQSGYFINFNGTAGVWRKRCIEDAGGWQSDTLTEDLDLSYRAQLKGWQFKYIESIGAPAELPVAMNALKGQQFRWTKGAAETAKKILPSVLKSPLPKSTKIHAFFHLMNSSIFVCILGCALLSIPLLIIKHSENAFDHWFKLAGIFSISFLILMIYYGASYFSNKKLSFKNLFNFFFKYIVFLSVSMGLCVHNSIAVIQAWLGIKTPFIRTPKFNLIGSSKEIRPTNYHSFKISIVQFLEIVLLIYAVIGLALGITFNEFGLFPFHLMLTFGLGYILTLSFIHGRKYSIK